MVLYVANAGGWVLRVLARSVGRLCPTLGSFIDFYVLTLIDLGLIAPPLRCPWCIHGPAITSHHGPQGHGDGAVVFLQAAPPPVDRKHSLSAMGTGPSPVHCTAPSTSTRDGRQVATVASWSLTATLLFHIAADAVRRTDPPATRAVTMTLHNHGDIGWS